MIVGQEIEYGWFDRLLMRIGVVRLVWGAVALCGILTVLLQIWFAAEFVRWVK